MQENESEYDLEEDDLHFPDNLETEKYNVTENMSSYDIYFQSMIGFVILSILPFALDNLVLSKAILSFLVLVGRYNISRVLQSYVFDLQEQYNYR